jgi:hypothetical protein
MLRSFRLRLLELLEGSAYCSILGESLSALLAIPVFGKKERAALWPRRSRDVHPSNLICFNPVTRNSSMVAAPA